MEKQYSLLILLLILSVSFVFDNEVSGFIVNHRVEQLNWFFILFSNIYFIFAVFFVLFLLLYRKKRNAANLIISLFSVFLVVTLLKLLVARPRPEVIALLDGLSYSFPSRHAALVFAPYALISKNLKNLKIPYLIFAVLVSFSRLYNGVHFLSDIIVGAAIGYVIGWFDLKLEDKHKYAEKAIEKLKP